MNKIDLIKKFDLFNHLNILVIGDVMIDAYIWGYVNRISPEAPIPIVNAKKRENRLGGAANVALNMQALGCSTILCSVIGNDERGRLLLSLMTDDWKMSTKGIISDDSRTTTTKFRIISNGQHLLRVDEEDDKMLNKEIENKFIENIKNIFAHEKINAIVFEDYDKGVITPFIISAVVDLARHYDIPVLVDPKKRNFLEYRDVTLFKPNFKELCEGLNLEIDKSDFDAIFRASQRLQERINAKYIFITLSELGVFLSDGSMWRQIPAEIREIVDVSGAGDTVIGTTAVCLAAGFDIHVISKIANIAGGLVCEKVGVVPINKSQLLSECLKVFF